MGIRGWAAVIALVVLTNAGIFIAWDYAFPHHPLLPSQTLNGQGQKGVEENLPETEQKSTAVVPATASLPGSAVLGKLMGAWPAMPLGWTSSESATGVPGSPLDLICPSQVATVPLASRSYTLNRIEPEPASIIVQASTFHAGLGAAAFTEIKQRSSECVGFTTEISSTIGAESLEITGPDGLSIIWFRFGDIIGMVSGRGEDVEVYKLAGVWAAGWFPILTETICPEINSTIADIGRSPLSPNYTGWLRPIPAAATPAQAAIGEAAGYILIQATSAGTGARPQAGGMANGVQPLPSIDILPSYPLEVSVKLPEDIPIIPEAPSSPTPPGREGKIVVAPAPDPLGPGCGWEFSGQEAPLFDQQTALAEATLKVKAMQAEQVKDIAKWWVSLFRYQIALSRYQEEVRTYNAWIAETSILIATAWWKAYDKEYTLWEKAHRAWQREYAVWEIAMQECQVEPPTDPETETASSPISTPTPTPNQTAECPPEPEEPEEPSQPNLPRPISTQEGNGGRFSGSG